VVTRAEALTPVMNHRMTSSQRRRYEKLRRVPAGFVTLGDAICSFNPIYGQGMSSSALQAVALGRAVARHGIADTELPKGFYRQAAKVIDSPWKIAVGADFAYPETTGPKPIGTNLVNRYMARVLMATRVSPEINATMLEVQQLTSPPSVLFRPSFILAVRKAARQAERQMSEEPAAPLVPAAAA